MKQEIEPHYTNEEIMFVSMKPEVGLLKVQLDFIISEIEFFNDLLSSNFFLEDSRNEEDLKFIFNRLRVLKDITLLHTQTVLDFRIKLDDIRECEDLQCEHHYIQEHVLLKSSMEKHFSEIRKFKEILHQFISKNVKP